MKVSYDWLKSFFEGDLPSAKDVAELLMFGAFEVEGVEEVGGDSIIDVDVLPNRAHDCLSHLGIAREVAVLGPVSGFSDPLSGEYEALKPSSFVEVSVEEAKRCGIYIACLIENVSVGPSPEWLKKRLRSLGQRSVNNVVDATNYVMFAIGQPLHAFDADKLSSRAGKKAICVRAAREGESIEILGGGDVMLNSDVTVIADMHADLPIALAGVKGGTAAEVGEQTKTIILEAANFNPSITRKTSQSLNIRTDASKRFENGIADVLAYHGIGAAARMIEELSLGQTEGYALSNMREAKRVSVSFGLSEANSLLGTSLSNVDVESVLKRLGFQYQKKGDKYEVSVPVWRLDIAIAEDMIEEIGRVYGYGKIKAVPLPPLGLSTVVNIRHYTFERMRGMLEAEGWREVYTYSLAGSGDVELANSFTSDKGFLRRDLAASMRKVLDDNIKNLPLLGGARIRAFELGDVFLQKGEVVRLALGDDGSPGTAAKEEDSLLADMSRKLMTVFGDALSKVYEDESIIEYEVDVSKIETGGAAYPEGARISESARYEPISQFPFVLRDIAVWAPQDASSDEAEEIIVSNGGELLVSTELFDSFGKGERSSYAFHLVFLSREKTLSDSEVNEIMKRLEGAMEERGFEVR